MLSMASLAAEIVRAAAHSLMWGLQAGTLTSLVAYMWVNLPTSRKSNRLLSVPIMCTLLGTVLVLLDLTRHVILDQGYFGPELRMYSPSGGGLTVVGRCGMVATWLGFVLILVGTLWFLQATKPMSSGSIPP
mmetsp:Transcript_23432/g.43143  ORF Transcript_23432/g.43143 Transcript_23432/m.43143 type:complete len:132 (-) Transcript_23432:84-479(-)